MAVDLATLEAVFLVAMGGWLIVLGGAFLLGQRTVDRVSSLLLVLAGVYAILWQQPALLGVGEAVHVAIAQPVFLLLLSGAIFLWTYWLFERHVERLEVTLSDLEDSLRLERTLVDILGHDLRNPIASAKLGVDSLAREHPSLADELEPVQDDLRKATDAMNNGVVVSRLSSATEETPMEVLDLAEMTREVVEDRQAHATELGVDIQAQVPEDLQVEASPLLRHAIANLLDNALEFSPEGGRVTVSLGVEDEELVLSVVDQGPGIPAEERERLFDRFEKGGESTGAGLGLAIVDRLVSLHGGEIEVGERPGSGTRAEMRLPWPREDGALRPRTGSAETQAPTQEVIG